MDEQLEFVKLIASRLDSADIPYMMTGSMAMAIYHNDWVIKADFIIRKNEDYRREEFARRKKMDIEGVVVSVVTAEDLILSKLVWGKQSRSDLQLNDVRQMTSAVSELDWRYMRKWAAVLGVDDLLRKAETNE